MIKIFPKQRGLFLVLFIIALAVLMAVVLFGGALSSVGRRADSTTQNPEKFAAINAALTQFLQLNLRLPCPAAKLSATGREDTASSTDTATCLSPSGVVPWTTLGLTKEAALDGWSRMISYRVYDAAITGQSATKGFTRTDGLNLSDCLDSDVMGVPYQLSGPPFDPSSGLGTACNPTTHKNARSDFFDTKGLNVCLVPSAFCGASNKKTQVAYVLISHGASGIVPSTSSTAELQNADAGGNYWVLDPSAAEISAEDANHFDDVVSYTSARDLVVAAKVGGRAWLAMKMDRTDTAAFPLSVTTEQTPSPREIAFSGGPIMMSAFKSGVPRDIASIWHSTTPPYYSLGAKVAGGSGDLSSGEGLGFDFNLYRVKRRVLKVTLVGFNLSGQQALFTFYNGSTQVAQVMKLACTSGVIPSILTVDVGGDFNKVEIQAPSPSSFSVASIAACRNAACILPVQPGQGVAVNCP